jgi:hypothetical protein
MPQAFKDAYPNTRVFIDCTEIYIEMPTLFRSQSATYSSYKNHNTGKGHTLHLYHVCGAVK